MALLNALAQIALAEEQLWPSVLFQPNGMNLTVTGGFNKFILSADDKIHSD